MKTIGIFFALILLFSTCLNLIGSEPELPQLLSMKSVDQEVIGWHWRTGLGNEIYPYLKIQVNQLFFLNPAEETIRQVHHLPNSKVVTSKNQAFVGFIDIDEQYQIPEDLKQKRGIRYHITNSSGEEIYTIRFEMSYDKPIPALYLANNGRSVLVDGYRGIVEIFQLNGSLIQQIDLFDDDILDYEKPIACAVANEGELFAIVAQKYPMSIDSNTSIFVSGEPYLFCFSLDGKEILKNPLELNTVAEVAISPSGNHVVVSQYTPEREIKSTILDLNGDIVLEIPTLFRYAQFSSDDSLLLLADKKTLFEIDLQKRAYSTSNIINPDKDRMVAEIFFAETDRKILILTAKSVFQNSRFEYIEPGLLEFEQKGEKLWEVKFNGETFITPSIFSDSNYLGIGFHLNYRVYRENSE